MSSNWDAMIALPFDTFKNGAIAACGQSVEWLIPFTLHVEPGDGTQLTRLALQTSLPLSHHTGPPFTTEKTV